MRKMFRIVARCSLPGTAMSVSNVEDLFDEHLPLYDSDPVAPLVLYLLHPGLEVCHRRRTATLHSGFESFWIVTS